MPPEIHTDPFEFLCAILSPCTPDDEIRELRRIAACGEVDWPAVAEHANRADLAPALCVALEDRGLASEAPELFQEYLQELHRFNLDRNQALLQQLREVVRLLNDVGVTPLLLKGAAAMTTDLYPDPGMRFMADLDLLVPEELLRRSVAAVRGTGYEVPEKYQALADSPALHHYPYMVCPGAPAVIELHRRVLIGRDLLESAQLWDNSRSYQGSSLPGLSAALLSPTDEIVYCFAHSELTHNHHRYERIDTRHLLEFVFLISRYRDEIAWEKLEALKHHPRYGRAFESYLYQAKKLFRMDHPMCNNLDSHAGRHYHRVVSSFSWWDRRCRLLRVVLKELLETFSQGHMHDTYLRNDISIWYLRFRYLGRILGRCWRPEVWKARFRRMKQH